MTLCVSWIRKKGKTEELIIATDSRLSSGTTLDGCCKIFPLKRGDCVLAFAGNTMYAYPIFIHIQRAIDLNVMSLTRANDITELIHYFEDIMNKCLEDSWNLDTFDKEKGPNFQAIISGYSWKYSIFEMFIYSYDAKLNKMYSRRTTTLKKNKIAIIGDETKEFKKKLYFLLEERKITEDAGLNMEPFEILLSFIENKSFTSIGGAPQLVKVYKYMNTVPFGVFWPQKDLPEIITFFGRRLLNYETFPFPIIHPKTFKVSYMKKIDDTFNMRNEEQHKLPFKVSTKKQ